MHKQVYEINENGYIQEIYVAEFNEEGIPLLELEENIVTVSPPHGLYRAKWTGVEWGEGLEKSKLDEIEYQQYLDSLKPSEDEIKKAQTELLVMNLLFDMEVM